MDGEDLSIYDSRGFEVDQNGDDSNTLNELEWELASQTGRLTGAMNADWPTARCYENFLAD